MKEASFSHSSTGPGSTPTRNTKVFLVPHTRNTLEGGVRHLPLPSPGRGKMLRLALMAADGGASREWRAQRRWTTKQSSRPATALAPCAIGVRYELVCLSLRMPWMGCATDNSHRLGSPRSPRSIVLPSTCPGGKSERELGFMVCSFLFFLLERQDQLQDPQQLSPPNLGAPIWGERERGRENT